MAGRGRTANHLGRAAGLCGLLLVRYFITGQSILGRPTDNATYLYAATQDLRGKPYEKLSAPIWHRLARRWAVLGVPLIFATLWLTAGVVRTLRTADPAWTHVDWLAMAVRWWILAAAALLIWATVRFVNYMRTRDQVNEFVYPAWEAACDAMGADRSYRGDRMARRMVQLPDDFKPSDGSVVKTHGWMTAWFYRWRERRQQARDQKRAEAAQSSEEPDTVEPSTELVPVTAGTELQPYKQPPWTRFLPRRGSHVAADLLDDPVRISLIPGKCNTKAERDRLTLKVGDTLGMPGPKAEWRMRGRSPYVELRPNHPPPPSLTFEEITSRLADVSTLDAEAIQYALDHPLIGLSYGDRAEVIDFVNDSPHVLISGAPGTGKTNLVKFILCQRMHLGSALVVLDFKQVSHRWARDLPGCRYASEIEDIHNLLVEVGEEVTRRKRNAIPPGADLDTPLNIFGTLDVLVEEANALALQLRDYWTDIRQPGDPLRSPAVRALKDAVFLGREFAMHIFVVAQRASANVFGPDGGDVRESFQIRLMSGWTIQTWKMLAGGTPFIRCPKGPRGIWARVQDGGAAIVRVPKTADKAAQAWAMSGIPSPIQALSDAEPTPDVAGAVRGPVSLSDAVPYLHGMTLGALQKAAQRSGFPARVGTGKRGAGLYELEALQRWRRARIDGEIVTEMEVEFVGPGLIYLFWVLVDGARRIGYIGKTRRPLELREEEHRGDKPWADLIDGDDPTVLWQSAECGDTELGEMEEHFIRTLFPLYNIEFQLGAEHAVPKWTQIEERHARDVAAGRPLWQPRDVYNERKAVPVS